jgi:hypothetical protein
MDFLATRDDIEPEWLSDQPGLFNAHTAATSKNRLRGGRQG